MDAADDTGRVGDHITAKARNLTFRGNAGTGVSGGAPTTRPPCLVDGSEVDTVTANAQGIYRFDGVNLPARARAYTLRVESDGLRSPNRNVRVVR